MGGSRHFRVFIFGHFGNAVDDHPVFDAMLMGCSDREAPAFTVIRLAWKQSSS